MIGIAFVVAAMAAGEPATLDVRVTDPTGAPLPSAVVTFEIEGSRHRVKPETGGWSATTLFPTGGAPIPLVQGTSVAFWVTAPGMTGTRVAHILAAKPKKDTLVVKLAPLVPPALACWSSPPEPKNGRAIAETARVALMSVEGEAQGCALGAQAWGLGLDLLKMEAEYQTAPTDELVARIFTARQAAIEATEAWRAWTFNNGDPEVTVPLCISLRASDKGCRG